MQKQCPQCGKLFESHREGEGELCPECARGGFRRASAPQNTSPDWERRQKTMLRKQEARARKLGRIELEKKGMPPGRIVLLLLAMCLVLAGALLFWISARSESGMLATMPPGNQLAFSLFLNALAAVLLFLALRRHVIVALVFAACVLAWGWFVPVLWPSGVEVLVVRAREAQPEKAEAAPSTILSGEELAILEQTCREQGPNRVWGLYVESPIDGAREQIRKFLARLSKAKRTVAYSRHQGFLFVMEGTSASEEDIRELAGRLGHVLSVSPEKRLAEVRFDAQGSHYENEYPPEVLLDMTHPAFVRANLHELRCLDPARIVTAAENLEAAHTIDFRADIRQTLLDVLKQPWSGQEYVQSALVRALLAYAEPKDAPALAESRRLFETLISLNLTVPETLVNYLVDNDPDYITGPLLALWVENSVYWEPWLTRLGTAAQPELLNLLGKTDNLQLIGGILKHLEREGTPDALPAVRRFQQHEDTLICKAAHEAEAQIAARERARRNASPAAAEAPPKTGTAR